MAQVITHIEKIDDTLLENVSGGMIEMLGKVILVYGALLVASGVCIVGGTIGAIWCGVAGAKSFSNGDKGAGAGCVAGAVGCCGAAAAGVSFLYAIYHS